MIRANEKSSSSGPEITLINSRLSEILQYCNFEIDKLPKDEVAMEIEDLQDDRSLLKDIDKS